MCFHTVTGTFICDFDDSFRKITGKTSWEYYDVNYRE
uniref:Uncharacterized protein n=1 Tax=Rhizophora mucronata TaxID=61149 RepID=A0A2P2QUS6_RHIMU